MRLPPDEVMCLLAEYEARMVSVVQRHRGSLDKFIGDGIMATSGGAQRSETCAAAGLEPLDIHFAVAVGPVVFGAVSDETRLEYTVIGNAVDLAAKLERHNKAEGTWALTTAACRERASEQGFALPAAATERADCAIEGVIGAVDLMVLAA
jgi:adenylate cyclase